MVFLYNLSIQLYKFLIALNSPFKDRAKLFVEGRKEVWNELKDFKNGNDQPVAWFHAASLGEFEQGLPVMEAFKNEYPNHQIVISFFSPSGYEEKKDHDVADFTCYLPMDTKSNAERFIETLNPSVVLFIKYEYWFHYLNTLKKKRIPLFSISATFTEKHIFFNWYGGLHRRMLKMFDYTFVQNSKSKMLLESVGVQDSSVSGDTRFDRVKQTLNSPKVFKNIQEYTQDTLTLIVGSAWPEDMSVLNKFINEKAGKIKVIIAPHLIDRENIKRLTRQLDASFQLFTEGELDENVPVLILDTMGMLSSTYQYGDMAYIGGAFGDGLHNILEAVAFGLPVVFGNKGLEKFPETEELITLGGAFTIENSNMANEVLNNLLIEEFRKGASEICTNYVEENTGATEKIMSYLKKHLE